MDAASADLISGSVAASVMGAAWTWGLALLLGAALVPRLEVLLGGGRDQEPVDARLLAWMAVGIPVQALGWLLLGAFGALSERSVIGGALVLTVAAAGAARGVLVAATSDVVAALAAWCGDRLRVAMTAAFGLFLLAVGGLALRPTIFYDDLVYHLGLPRQALLIGSWPAYEGYHYSFLPSGWDACYLLPLSLGGGHGPQFMNVIAVALLALAVRALARDLGAATPVSAGLATLLFMLAPVTLSLGAFAGNDLFVAFALNVALRRAAVGAGGWAGAITTGLVAGGAWATKYTSLPAVAAVGLLWLLSRPGSPARRFGQAAALGLAALVPAAGWTLRALVLTGNPLYPAFFGVLGGRHWTEASAALVRTDIAHGALADRGPAAFVLGAWDLLVHSSSMGAPSGLAPAFLVVAILGIAWGRPTQHRGALLAALGLCYVGWCMTSLNLRYALMLVAGFSPFAAALMDRLAGVSVAAAGAKSRARRSTAWLLFALVLMSGIGAVGQGLRVHLSLYSFSHFGLAEVAAAGRELDRRLPADARLLLVGEARMALFPRPVLGASAYDRPVVAPWVEAAGGPADLTRAFRDEGITHLVVNERELARWYESYAWEDRLPPGGHELLRRWVAEELVPFWGRGPVRVWALPGETPPATP